MYLVAIGWLYVVFMMAAAEALSPQGTVFGTLITFFFYGVGPSAVVMYILTTPARKARLRQRELAESTELAELSERNEGSHAPADGPVPPVAEKP